MRDAPAQAPPTTRAIVAVLAILVVASTLSIASFDLRRRALAFHERDFGFFAQQYAHLLDVPVYDRVALSPNGNDAFGFRGIDGHPTVHHEVHASPIKYPLALLYRATGSLGAVHVALLVPYLLALAYALHRASKKGVRPELMVSALAVLTLTPPFVAATTFDLRPFTALGAFVMALASALLSRASGRDLAVIAVAGLLVREDAAPMLAIAAGYLALDARPREARGMYLGALAYVIAFHVVFACLTPFVHRWTPDSAGALATFTAYPMVRGLERAPSLAASVTQRFRRHRTLAAAAIGVPFFGAALMIVVDEGVPLHGFVSSGRWYSAWAIVVLVVTVTMALRSTARAQRRVAFVSGLVSIAGLIWTGFDLRRWSSDAESHAALVELAGLLPRDVQIVTDYPHYQAFAERDDVLVWDRFPAHLAPSDARDRAGADPGLLRDNVRADAWIVLAPTRRSEVLGRVAAAGAPTDWRPCRRGDDWVALAPAGDRALCTIGAWP